MANAGQNHAAAFMMHRGALLDLLEQLPDDRSDFAAWEGGMSFHRLTDHLAGSSERTLAMLRGETPQKPELSPDFASAKQRLHDNAATMQQTLSNLSDEQLGTVIEAFGGRKMPVSSLLEFLRYHEAHHKGQVWMMARMVGVMPPRFVKMG